MKTTHKGSPFGALDECAKTGFISNVIAIANHHAEASRMLTYNVLNSLLLLNWGAIVAMAAFLAAVKGTALGPKSFQITLVFFTHAVGIFSALSAKALAAWYSDEKAGEYRRYLKDAIAGDKPLVWDQINSNQGGKILIAGCVVFFIGVLAFCIGLGVSISLVVAQTGE